MWAFYIILQLRCHKQYTDNHDKVAQPTVIANTEHQDNQNVQSNSNRNLEEQTISNQIYGHPDLQFIIIDMAPVTFIDSSGSNMLERVSTHACHYNNYVDKPAKTVHICTNYTS